MVDLGIGFDPGKTTGIAICQFDDKGKFDGWLTVTQVAMSDMPEWFRKFKKEHKQDTVRKIVYEKFVTYRQYAQRQIGSNQPASQIIGMIKMFASDIDTAPVEQKADVLKIGYRWLDMKQPSNHAESHRYDAMAHMYYWLVQNERAEPKVTSFKEKFGDR